MPEKAPEEPKPPSFATPNPWSALPRKVYVGKGRGKKEGATTESPVDGQDQPKIYTIRDHTLEVLMHPDVLELHAVRVVHTPHGDERQLHLKVRVRYLCNLNTHAVHSKVAIKYSVARSKSYISLSTLLTFIPCYTRHVYAPKAFDAS